jgi:hypothetical protein
MEKLKSAFHFPATSTATRSLIVLNSCVFHALQMFPRGLKAQSFWATFLAWLMPCTVRGGSAIPFMAQETRHEWGTRHT